MPDKEWYWYDIYDIINSSIYRENLLNSIDSSAKDYFLFRKGTTMRGSYSRYDKLEFPQKLLTNSVYCIQPDLSDRCVTSFETITNNRALALLEVSLKYRQVFLFYSGGLDSTTILCSLLKNWSSQDLARITLVMNQYSIDENKKFYEIFIHNRFTTVSTTDYFNNRLMNNESLYITGDLGGAIMNSDNSDVTKIFSETYNKPWKSNVDSILKYFTDNSTPTNGIKTFEKVVQTFDKLQYEVESINDFFWWVNFNWGWDIELYYAIWYWRLSPGTDTKDFLEKNLFLWFNTIEYQVWAITNSEPKIGDLVSMDKLPMKKYIYDFNNDRDYFLYKKDEASVSKNKSLITSRLCGVDSNYNIYYRKLNNSIPLRKPS
jgi:hypothetical protein